MFIIVTHNFFWLGGKMRKVAFTVFVVVLVFACFASAKEITLKKSFFTGWKYSVDGEDFQKVGFTGSSLRYEMEGNDAAQREMDTYKSRKIMAAVTGWPGGFLIGWPIGGAIANGWKDSYNVMLAVGVPLTIISTVYEISANDHLKKAVRIYNGEEQVIYFGINYNRVLAAANGRVTVGFTWTF